MSDEQPSNPIRGGHLLDRSKAAALVEPVLEVIEALEFARRSINAAPERFARLVAEVMADWQRYLETGEKSWVQTVEECADPPEPEPSLCTPEDWQAFRFHAQGGWRPKCESLAKELKLAKAGFEYQSAAIEEEASRWPERPTSPEELDAVLEGELRRIDRLLGILQPLAEDLRRSVADPPRVIVQELPANPTSDEDGPFPGGFRWNGEEIDYHDNKVERKPARLIDHLWGQLERWVEFNKLAEPVWEDTEEFVSTEMVRPAQKKANKFFKEYAIPLEIQMADKKVRMQRRPT